MTHNELFRECLHRIKREDITDNHIIRQDLTDSLFHLEKALTSFNDDDIHWFMIRNELPYYIYHHLNKAETEYTVNLLKEWFKAGYKPITECIVTLATKDLSTNDESKRLLRLDDKTLVNLISEHCEKSFLYLKRHLKNTVVRKHYFKKANEGDIDYAFHLADYLYQVRRYEKAFRYLTEIDTPRYKHESYKYLGLMYFYGHGIARDYDLAQYYLENSDIHCSEIIYALGEIYIHKGVYDKAVGLYQPFLIDPYSEKRDNRFYLNIMKRFIEIRSTFGIGDWIAMTVKIGRNNRKCEFAIELPAFCHVLISWGGRHSRVNIYQSGLNGSRMTFSHIYINPGEYVIDLQVACPNSIESIDFSKYKGQLKHLTFHRCRGLKKLSIPGQSLSSLDLPPSGYLYGIICRGNNIESLDLGRYPRVTHLDCSYNPIIRLKLHNNSPLTKACLRSTRLDKETVAKILRSNRGSFCNRLHYASLTRIDMRLEYYFRCTPWDKVRKYLRHKIPYYYYHTLSECELAFHKLRKMARKNNRTPYKKGFLEMLEEYVSDDTIVGHEEFFLEKEPWAVSLATRVRDRYHKEPWIKYEPTPCEYYVACCLVNMIHNDSEMEALLHISSK